MHRGQVKDIIYAYIVKIRLRCGTTNLKKISLTVHIITLLVSGKVFHDRILKGKGQIKHVCVDLKLRKKVACKELFPAL